ncbi:hypothetical protein TNCV_4670771 [Trichonephila clavipes]|nr:hypothetical protein TNCV_4670771 [Trichonephila clavipes]
MFGIITRRAALHGILYVLEDFWHVTFPPAVTDIPVMRSSTEGTEASYTNSSCDQNRTHATFCSHLKRLCDAEHACSSNIPDSTAERHSHYNLQLHTLSAR